MHTDKVRDAGGDVCRFGDKLFFPWGPWVFSSVTGSATRTACIPIQGPCTWQVGVHRHLYIQEKLSAHPYPARVDEWSPAAHLARKVAKTCACAGEQWLDEKVVRDQIER